jgi:hypothetical protein
MLTKRIFASHYQFYIFDSNFDDFLNPRLDWMEAEREKFGYLSTKNAIYVSTVADLNDHRLRVFLEQTPSNNYERIYERNLLLESGVLVISAPANDEADDLKINLQKGVYKIFVCSNSIGKDMFSYEHDYEEEMSDEEYFEHDEFENYDIFILKTYQQIE